MSAEGLTSTQREALEWLAARRDNHPRSQQSYGFNPPSGRSRLASAMRRALAERGFVEVQRVSDRHLRYEITDAGRAALLGSLADATNNPVPLTLSDAGSDAEGRG
jgi:hypothetical protein